MTPNLCLFTDSLEPSGVGEHMLLLAEALRHRFNISFVCPNVPASQRILSRAECLGLKVWPAQVRSTEAEDSLIEWLKAEQIDVFHCHAGIGWEGHHGIYAAYKAEVPAIVRTEHLPYLLTDRRQRRDHRKVVQLTDKVICVSEAAGETFRENGIPSGKIKVVRNGIKPSHAGAVPERTRARLKLPSKAQVILTIGRFTEQKGHIHLLDAIPAILSEFPDAHFLWVGDGPLEEELRFLVCSKNLSEQVHFLGRRADVADLTAASDLFVLPSLFEGLPLVVLESMAAGLPVIATDVCGTAETIEDGISGRLVPAGDPAALSAAITVALKKPVLMSDWISSARMKFDQEFDVSVMAASTAEIYREVLNQMQMAA